VTTFYSPSRRLPVWGQSNQSVCSGLLECRRTSWDQDRPPLRLLCLLLLSLALFQVTVREGHLLTKMHSDKVLSYAQCFVSFPIDTPIQLLTSRNLKLNYYYYTYTFSTAAQCRTQFLFVNFLCRDRSLPRWASSPFPAVSRRTIARKAPSSYHQKPNASYVPEMKITGDGLGLRSKRLPVGAFPLSSAKPWPSNRQC
jgi:hypothetical protein